MQKKKSHTENRDKREGKRQRKTRDKKIRGSASRTLGARRANTGLRDKCRVLVVALLEQIHTEALGVRAQLLDGAGAKRVARDERNLSASLDTHMAARG